MARQWLGEKKVNQLRKQTRLDIVGVLIRGNTNHRRDLCLADGTVMSLYKSGELELATIVWSGGEVNIGHSAVESMARAGMAPFKLVPLP